MHNIIIKKIFLAAAIALIITPALGSDMSLSVKGGYFHYSEPDVGISYSGLVSGLQGDFRKSFPAFSLKLRSEFMSGRLSYDGQLNTHQMADGSAQVSENSGAAISYDADLWYSDSVALLGKSFSKKKYRITPYAGLGYRYLNNPENSSVPYDYSRQVSYLYLPLALEIEKTGSPEYSWGLVGEIDILLHGSAKADISDASDNYNNLEFDQSLGGAVKVAGFYNRQLLGLSVSVKPFIDVWFVDSSDTDVLTYDGTRVLVRSADGSYGDYCEPANVTMTAGLQLDVMF